MKHITEQHINAAFRRIGEHMALEAVVQALALKAKRQAAAAANTAAQIAELKELKSTDASIIQLLRQLEHKFATQVATVNGTQGQINALSKTDTKKRP